MSNYHSIAVKNEIDTLDINELCREAISVYIEQLGGDAGQMIYPINFWISLKNYFGGRFPLIFILSLFD